MGAVVYASSMETVDYSSLMRPIIFCAAESLSEVESFPLNIDLAKLLLNIPPKRRTMRLESCIKDVICSLPDNTVIRDFDVIFNPDYKVDIMKIFIDICKNKPFSIIWPGRYENGTLFYSEDGYPDFKSYKIEDYDITCII